MRITAHMLSHARPAAVWHLAKVLGINVRGLKLQQIERLVAIRTDPPRIRGMY